MAFDVAGAVEKLSEAVKSGFRFAETAKEKQSETAILKDRKKLQKAVNYAEQLILLMYPYFKPKDDKEQKVFENLLEKFLENN